MIIFSLAPKRVGQLDFLIQFILNFLSLNKKYIPIILFFDKKLFLQFKKNIVLYKIVKNSGYCFLFNIPKLPLINVILKIIIILPFLVFFLIKKNNIVFIYKSIYSVSDKFIYFFNKFRGRTFTYLANNTYNDLINRYFDKDNDPVNRVGDKVTILESSNSGDGLLINSDKAEKFLKLKGYKNFKIVGFPFLNKPFQTFIKDNSFKIINEELGINISEKNEINSILINKFWGRWSNQSVSWLKSNLSQIIKILVSKNPKCIILIRPYPVENNHLEEILSEINNSNIYLTYTHPSSLSHISNNVIGLAQSSVCLSCVGFGTPYFEISSVNADQKKLYEKGSIYSEYCTVVDDVKNLDNLIIRNKNTKISVEVFKEKIGHKDIEFNELIFGNNE